MTRPKERWDFRDRAEFVLEDKQWERFLQLLDRPPRATAGLVKLFSKASVFSGR